MKRKGFKDFLVEYETRNEIKEKLFDFIKKKIVEGGEITPLELMDVIINL
ncbi:MAG: hypothetical protein LBQ24_00805 [Candidatus Peribacteria bacterium]|jgi:hypothetical protein|nr:hypothetical protein [Candidatus Peribacteria bacterium]